MGGVDLARLAIGDHRIACPRCDKGPKDDALSVTVKPDGAVWNCFRCGWTGSERQREARPTFAPAKSAKPERRRGLLPRDYALWMNAPTIPGTPVDKYLRARRCYFPPVDGALRYLPDAYHWPTKTRHPAMLALVTDAVSRVPLSLHYTFLRADGSGKADVEKQKLLAPGYEIGGGVIRLWPDEAVTTGLGIAEGIETALSAAHGFRPMWSTIDAGHLAKVPILERVEFLHIFADNDRAGATAAIACAEHWRSAGRNARWLAPAGGGDFNDEIRRKARR